MANKLTTDQLTSDSRLLVDTNVWQYIYGVQASNEDPGYSDLLGTIEEKGIKLYTNPQIVSEYINLNVRIAYKAYKKSHQNIYNFKKDYQPTEDFQRYYDDAITTIDGLILPYAELTPANNIKVTSPIKDHCLKDFNDEIIANDAFINHLSVLTHDKDYANFGLDLDVYRLSW